MERVRRYGPPPYRVAVVHGGPGAGGEMAPVAGELAHCRGVLEPIQTATSLEGQVQELKAVVEDHGTPPAVLIGFSWGAWLSFILAARYPAGVEKIILVGSGPFEQRYVADLERARSRRLSPQEREAYDAALTALRDPGIRDGDRFLAELGRLAHQSDTYEPFADRREGTSSPQLRGDVFRAVWAEAAELRRSGELLELGRSIECPVVAIHGDHDPHPAEGVWRPLTDVLDCFRFIVLDRCGHRPWIERHARDAFFARLEEELPQPFP